MPPEIQSVEWYNNGRRIELSDKYRFHEDGEGRFSLESGPLEIGDDGEWKCVVKSDGGYATSMAKVILAGITYILVFCFFFFVMSEFV